MSGLLVLAALATVPLRGEERLSGERSGAVWSLAARTCGEPELALSFKSRRRLDEAVQDEAPAAHRDPGGAAAPLPGIRVRAAGPVFRERAVRRPETKALSPPLPAV